LDSGGQESLWYSSEKQRTLNISAVLGVGKDNRHGTQIISGQGRRSLSEADRLFHVVDAINAAAEEQLQNIDVVRFVSHSCKTLPRS
jgi:hypothetical protein